MKPCSIHIVLLEAQADPTSRIKNQVSSFKRYFIPNQSLGDLPLSGGDPHQTVAQRNVLVASMQPIERPPASTPATASFQPAALEATLTPGPYLAAAGDIIGQPLPVVAPIYVQRDLKTVHCTWREYKEGMSSDPAVQELEAMWGAKWRPSNNARTLFCRRKLIYLEVERLVSCGLPALEALIVLEEFRHGKKLYSLSERLRAGEWPDFVPPDVSALQAVKPTRKHKLQSS